MRFLIVFTLFFVASLNVQPVLAADNYEAVKEDTMHTGGAGFDKRHKAYARHIMGKRQSMDASSVANIAPAAGDEVEAELATCNGASHAKTATETHNTRQYNN